MELIAKDKVVHWDIAVENSLGSKGEWDVEETPASKSYGAQLETP